MYRVRFPTETWPLHTSTSSRVSRLSWNVVFPERVNQFFFQVLRFVQQSRRDPSKHFTRLQSLRSHVEIEDFCSSELPLPSRYRCRRTFACLQQSCVCIIPHPTFCKINRTTPTTFPEEPHSAGEAKTPRRI
jgi:hypothetical protein